MRISDWSSDVCSSDLCASSHAGAPPQIPDSGHNLRNPDNFLTASDVIAGSSVLSSLPTLPRFSEPVRHEVDFGRYSALRAQQPIAAATAQGRSEEHTSELQSLMRISYAVFCLKKKNQ